MDRLALLIFSENMFNCEVESLAKLEGLLKKIFQILVSKGYIVFTAALGENSLNYINEADFNINTGNLKMSNKILSGSDAIGLINKADLVICFDEEEAENVKTINKPCLLVNMYDKEESTLNPIVLSTSVLNAEDVVSKIEILVNATDTVSHTIGRGTISQESLEKSSEDQFEQYKQEVKKNIEKLITNNMMEEAKGIIEQFESIVKNDVDIFSMKAIIAIMENELDYAKEILNKGLDLYRSNFDILYNLAYIYQINYQHMLAIQYYKKAMQNAKDKNSIETVYKILRELGVEESMEEILRNEVCKTSIVILTYNNLEYNKLCIESIRKYTPKETYEIIVVDNNSTDGTAEWLKQQKDIKLILNKKNVGFPKGCNQGIKASGKGNDILLLNNDIIVTPNWLENMHLCLYSDNLIGAVGAVSNSCSYYQAIPVEYNNIDEMLRFADNFNKSDASKWEQRVKLVGFCMLIKRTVMNEIGLLDERFTPGNFEDDDLSFRIQAAGYKLMLCKDTFIHHFGSTSFKKDAEAYNELLLANSKKFEEKWGFNSSYSTFIREEIIERISEPKEKEINVLEIGCACGATLLKIKSIYPNANIFGIELNENSAKIASTLADIRSENIENTKLSYEEDFFDYIIFADVLEHLYNPELVLRNMKRYLKRDGYILASVPNVMHYSVVRDLLNGNWSYADAGILDRTHVRFFTLNEIDKLFTGQGYNELEISSTVYPPTRDDEVFINKLLSLTDSDKKQQFETYQYIIKAKSGSTLGGYNFDSNTKNGNLIKGENNGCYLHEKEEITTNIDKSCDVRGIERMHFGKNVVIQKDCWLNIAHNSNNNKYMIEFGANTNIGRRSTISASNKIIFGKNVLVGPNVLISDHNHEYKHIGIPIMDQGITSYNNCIDIGDNVWIGTNSVILGDVRIGKNSIIAANSVVNSNIPDYCIVAGSPARVVKFFDIDAGKWIDVVCERELKCLIDKREDLLNYCMPITFLKSIQVEVSSVCNLQCPQCFNQLEGHRSHILTRSLWNEKIKPYLSQLTDIHLVGIGEPLLCKDLFYFIADSKEKNVIVHTTSNLQLVDENIAKKLVLSGLDELSFSCDGATSITYDKIRINGTFQKLKKSLELINKFKREFNMATPRLVLNFGALKTNIEELSQIVEFAALNNVDQIIAYHDIIYNEDLKNESLYHYKELSDHMFTKSLYKAKELGIKMFMPGLFSNPIKKCESDIYCSYPFHHLWIYSDGRVGPCCMDFPDRYILGDLSNSSIEEIWNSRDILNLRKQMSSSPSEICKFCVQHGKMNISDKRYFFRFKGSSTYLQNLVTDVADG
jgi:O-antigen biosynthesis protein